MNITDDLHPTIYNSPIVLNVISAPVMVNRYALQAEQEQPLHFKTLFSVEAQYIPQSLAISRVFQHALTSTLSFDTNKAISVANDAGLTIEQVINFHVASGSPEQTIAQVSDHINAVVGGSISDSLRNKIIDTIKTGFLNLNRNSESAWIFWSKESSSSTSYSYNLLFAIQQNQKLIAIPLGMLVHVDVSEEKVLFITISSHACYAVNLDGLKVSQALSG
ncbi:delta-endotoxin CytB [Musicola paradisiaca]|uniref:Delta-endotoxin CytB n=1 Tax=Musicola paradisiaca (strain Ech703) TaxID=579405 RepID=C6C3H2_MUSP7|nr:delta-endotoxin CytB [Musicola paradisiaca]ACS87270.1 delta-endotoxin CytB [Musicola paradisiaca Ech703]